MSATLGRAVKPHDNGSAPGMHDLEVLDGPFGAEAVEVVAAVDGTSTELWNVLHQTGGRWHVPGIAGGWMVQLRPTARARRLERELPVLLAALEEAKLSELPRRDDALTEWARSLSIRHLHQSASDYPGSVYFTVDHGSERTGTWLSDSGNALAEWASAFLILPGVQDVRDKLARAATRRRHAFVIFPGFAEAPFAVVDLLLRSDAPLPDVPPVLPDEVTDVWLVSTWASGHGVRWSPTEGWSPFAKLTGD